MSVIGLKGLSRLQFRLMVGQDDEGKPILRTRTLGRISPDATNEAVYEIGQQLMTLQKHPVVTVHRINSKELLPET